MSRGPAAIRHAAVALLLLTAAAWPAPVHGEGRQIRLVSSDGTPLAGTLYEAGTRPAPAVVLVHMYGRSAADWERIALDLQRAGLTALALDLRGHGASGGPPGPSRAMVGDVRAAVAWLEANPQVRSGSLALAGASLGASLALLAAVEEPGVRGVALVSPSLDYRGVRIDAGVMRKLGGRPALLVSSVDDPYALRTIRDLVEGDPGPREQRVSEIAAHGTALLAADSPLRTALVDWLRRTLVF